jgi:hypothetical protein
MSRRTLEEVRTVSRSRIPDAAVETERGAASVDVIPADAIDETATRDWFVELHDIRNRSIALAGPWPSVRLRDEERDDDHVAISSDGGTESGRPRNGQVDGVCGAT